jgi:hypothetical protein
MTDIQKLVHELDVELTDVMARDIRRVIDYLHSRGYLGEAPEWQPIETDPHEDDSGDIVDFLATDGFFTKVCAYDSGHFLGWPHITKPTHWMPLPDAPNTFKKDENIKVSCEHVDAVKVQDGMFKIGDLVEVSPNNEYYQDWKGTVLEITGIYRQRSIGYQTENTRPPIRYSVKDLKDSWTYGYTDDFSFDDLIAAAPKGETK